MSRIEEARKFRAQFLKLRDMATDEIAIQVADLYPVWTAGIDYKVGDRILYEDILYRVIQAHTSQESWTPVSAVSLFAKVLITDANVIPEWIQPDSTNAYKSGDKVMFEGEVYMSVIDNNIWSPSAYPAGWKKIAV